MIGTPGEGTGARGVAGPRPRGGTKERVRRWREETWVGWCLLISVEAAAASGGLWEEPGQSPKGDRISSMTSGWSMKAGIRRDPPRGDERSQGVHGLANRWADVAQMVHDVDTSYLTQFVLACVDTGQQRGQVLYGREDGSSALIHSKPFTVRFSGNRCKDSLET